MSDLGMVGYPVDLEVRGPDDSIVMRSGEKWDQSVMRVNTPRDKLLANIRSSIQRQLPQLAPHPASPQHVAVVGGGWSLDQTLDDLRRLYFDGVKLIALNGSAKWLMQRNLRPSMHIVLDARPDNAGFLSEPIPGCKYFLASQCDPALFDAVLGRNVTVFHAIADDAKEEIELLDDFYLKRWCRIPTAGTVGITSIMLLRTLGFQYQHLFGFDSCYSPDHRHHAFAQPLNENDGSAIFEIAGREFECSAWQASQAQSFMNMIAVNGEFVNLAIYGDGMLAHILKTGAQMMEAKENAE